MTYLAGDLGGTKTLLGLYDESGELLHSRRFESRAAAGLGRMVREFLAQPEMKALARPARAAFGVAGPIEDLAGGERRARITNLSFAIDSRELRAETGLERVLLCNDFYAAAAAAHAAAEGLAAGREVEGLDLLPLNPGAVPDPAGVIAVLGAGTGLGEAIVARTAAGPLILASEGGHRDFAPRDEIEIALLRFLMKRHGAHVSYERVLSGAGLLALYEFLREHHGAEREDPGLRAEIERDRARAPALISQRGMARSDALCDAALDLFIGLYGAEAGNLTLSALARGGVFLAGGIAQKILPRLAGGTFMRGFTGKGRFSSLCATVPVYVMTDPQVGLTGAAVLARRL